MTLPKDRISIEELYMGVVQSCVHLAHAMLNIAKRALEMETPRALQFFKIVFVFAGSKLIVQTLVLRGDFNRRGKVCPPFLAYRRYKFTSKVKTTLTIIFRWLRLKSTTAAIWRNFEAGGDGNLSSIVDGNVGSYQSYTSFVLKPN